MATSNVPSIPSYGEFRRFVGLQIWLEQFTPLPPRFSLFVSCWHNCYTQRCVMKMERGRCYENRPHLK